MKVNLFFFLPCSSCPLHRLVNPFERCGQAVLIWSYAHTFRLINQPA